MNRLTHKLVSLAAIVLVFGSCRQAGSSSVAEVQTRAFPQVQVPTICSTQEERHAYILDHFWDGFLKPGLYSDTLVFSGVRSEDLESAVGLYTTILGQASLSEARKSVETLVTKLEAFKVADSLSTTTQKVIDLMDRYLYDPNSPVRDEDIYGAYARKLAGTSLIPASRKGAYLHDAQMCALNERGTKAADFVFKQIDGRTRTLYSVKAPLTILFFSNPGCPSCREIIESLMARMYLVDMIERGELAIVNVYIDEEIDKWKEYQETYPTSWYNGYDPTFTIRQDLTYSVRAIPSLYVLDEQKNVIMKDAPQEKVLQMLDNLVTAQ